MNNNFRPKKEVFGSYYVLKNIGRVGRDFLIYFYYLYSVTCTIPWSWMAWIKVCLVVIVFKCIKYRPHASVHPDIYNLMVGELIFRTAGQIFG